MIINGKFKSLPDSNFRFVTADVPVPEQFSIKSFVVSESCLVLSFILEDFIKRADLVSVLVNVPVPCI